MNPTIDAPPTRFRISSLAVSGLWGIRDLDLRFNPEVNIIIGPNASGKTTILNLLRYVLTPDVLALVDIPFREIRVGLQAFNSNATRTLSVKSTGQTVEFRISGEKFVLPRDRALLAVPKTQWPLWVPASPFIPAHEGELQRLAEKLGELVPAAWLPVSRRLPIPEEDEQIFSLSSTKTRRLESVDARLKELLDELLRYRLGLDAKLSERYKQFERQVLRIILYSADDLTGSLSLGEVPRDEDKQLLLSAFDEAGLLDRSTRRRIEEHFSVMKAVAKRVSDEREPQSLTFRDISVLPLIPRTREMIQAARRLEESRAELFSPLRRFEELVSGFYANKRIAVSNRGELTVHTGGDSLPEIPVEKLSSGEKQILILLTQALLRENTPVVYVADEPELSLHVSWQERLLRSLVALGGEIQIIVATHSPDIVDGYRDCIIDLASP